MNSWSHQRNWFYIRHANPFTYCFVSCRGGCILYAFIRVTRLKTYLCIEADGFSTYWFLLCRSGSLLQEFFCILRETDYLLNALYYVAAEELIMNCFVFRIISIYYVLIRVVHWKHSFCLHAEDIIMYCSVCCIRRINYVFLLGVCHSCSGITFVIVLLSCFVDLYCVAG